MLIFTNPLRQSLFEGYDMLTLSKLRSLPWVKVVGSAYYNRDTAVKTGKGLSKRVTRGNRATFRMVY